jgi:hypothetical protein
VDPASQCSGCLHAAASHRTLLPSPSDVDAEALRTIFLSFPGKFCFGWLLATKYTGPVAVAGLGSVAVAGLNMRSLEPTLDRHSTNAPRGRRTVIGVARQRFAGYLDRDLITVEAADPKFQVV